MSTLPIPVLEGEMILKEDDKALYVKNALGLGYNILNGRLWLTSARLIHQDSPLGRITTYPLSHIVRAELETVSIAQKKFEIKDVYTSWTNFNAALCVTFDDGALDYFIPQDIQGWAQAITQSISSAPAVDYTQTPPQRPSLKSNQQGNPSQGQAAPKNNSKRLMVILIAIAALFICSVGLCVVVPFLMAIMRSGGGG